MPVVISWPATGLTTKYHYHLVMDSHSSKDFIPNFVALSQKYCLQFRHPFHKLRESSTLTLCVQAFNLKKSVWHFQYRMTFEHFLPSCFGVYCIAVIKMLEFQFISVLCHNLWKYQGLYICITAEIIFLCKFLHHIQ